MNDAPINVREAEGDIPPLLLVMTVVSCYLRCVSPPPTGFATGVCVCVSGATLTKHFAPVTMSEALS